LDTRLRRTAAGTVIRFRTNAATTDNDIRRSSQNARSRVTRINKRADHSPNRIFERDNLEHYNGHRPHRALNQLCPSQTEAGPPHAIDLAEHRVHRTAVLDRLINEYQVAS
jgi:hypothetical protein